MTDATLVANPSRERRRPGRRRLSLELFVEAVCRPGNWAATLAYSLGLQGRLRVSTTSVGNGRRVAAGLPPLRIAFASDFHAGGFTDQRILVDACQKLTALAPDVLLLGGDYVSIRAKDIRRLTPLLAAIPAAYGKFGVFGNHDLKSNHGIVRSELERAGVRLLTNEHVRLNGLFDDISICGLDDPTHGAPRADLAMDEATDTRVVVVHSPDAMHTIGDRPFDLALAGHTHGGQVRLPWGPPIVVPGGPLNRRYCAGHFDVGHEAPRILLVSHGVGCSGVPVRTFASPEVHLCLIT